MFLSDLGKIMAKLFDW